jgi:sec-independent protein translocase protein TatC
MARSSGRSGQRDGRMSLGQHLLEIRKRLVRAAAAILAGAVVGWFLSSFILAALRAPITVLAAQQHRLAELNYDSITAAFDLKIQIAITVGVVISSPVWLYQLWAFFVPALTRKELRYALGFFFSAVPLFLAGCTAGWFVVPHIVQLLISFAPSQAASFIQASDYFSFILKLVVAVGIAFILPVFLVLLNFVGVLSSQTILKSWRIAILLIVVFTAIVTPSADVVSMFLLAVPVALLYFAAAGVAVVHDRRSLKAAALLVAEYSA